MPEFEDMLLRAAPVWNVGNNTQGFLVWADRVEAMRDDERSKKIGAVLRGFAFALTGKRTLRPSVRRFLNECTGEEAIPWISKAVMAGCNTYNTVDFLNKNYRQGGK